MISAAETSDNLGPIRLSLPKSCVPHHPLWPDIHTQYGNSNSLDHWYVSHHHFGNKYVSSNSMCSRSIKLVIYA